VSTSLGKTVEAGKYVLDCGIQVGREVLKVDRIIIPIEDYDLILGMD
jgi:hypothetical protein